ncbi:MAG: dihydropteroate synthase [Nitrospirae bacterium]|nr:MAG: dihydropteroate synthase [Nitrospirota bacterium]
MGVLNVTPDSFSDGGRYLDPHAAIDHAQRMVDEGADMIDVGGESTRPGARDVAAHVEISRLQPVLRKLGSRLSVPLSVDTRKAEVAKMALDHGVVIVNDVSALQGDPAMAPLVAQTGAGAVLMHMPGTPQTMQAHCVYRDVVREVRDFLARRMEIARAWGIAHEQMIVDPGIGFGKTMDQNLQLLGRLPEFHTLGRPVLVGVSQKSFLGQLLGKSIEERTMGTAGAVAMSVLGGAHIVRVHHVGLMRDVVRTVEAIRGAVRDA